MAEQVLYDQDGLKLVCNDNEAIVTIEDNNRSRTIKLVNPDEMDLDDLMEIMDRDLTNAHWEYRSVLERIFNIVAMSDHQLVSIDEIIEHLTLYYEGEGDPDQLDRDVEQMMTEMDPQDSWEREPDRVRQFVRYAIGGLEFVGRFNACYGYPVNDGSSGPIMGAGLSRVGKVLYQMVYGTDDRVAIALSE